MSEFLKRLPDITAKQTIDLWGENKDPKEIMKHMGDNILCLLDMVDKLKEVVKFYAYDYGDGRESVLERFEDDLGEKAREVLKEFENGSTK